MNPFIEILRPNQWYKNLVIVLAPIFDLKFFELSHMMTIFAGFVILCALSGATYVINDLFDREKDKHHPEKRLRPIPSDKILPSTALAYGLVLVISSLTAAFYINWQFGFILTALFGITQAYSFILKNLALVDVIVLGVNFVLRAISGALIISIEISSWLILATFLVALTLAMGKRKAEAEYLKKEDAKKFREVLHYYTPELTHSFLLVIVSTLVISYSIYCVFSSPVSINLRPAFLLSTVPILYFIIFRFLFLIDNSHVPKNPEKVIKDPQIFSASALWLVVVIIFLYVL